jgi:signal transduction histidine kinase
MDSSDSRNEAQAQWDVRLKERAEAVIAADLPPIPVAEDLPRLVHDLRVHHVELEMQNEELQKTQRTLAEACDHYTQLYDFSPAGYVTMTPEGMIEEVNLRFCTMVDVHRKSVVHQPFSAFVVPQDWEMLHQHRTNVLALGTVQTCKLHLLPSVGDPLVVQVESMILKHDETGTVRIQTAMLDLTPMERAKLRMRESQRQVDQAAVKLLSAQQGERRRIARDLHDDYCQRLAAAILQIGLLPKQHRAPWTDPAQQLVPLKAILTGLLTDLRLLSHDLHPNLGYLDEALRGYLADFQDQAGIAVTLQATPRFQRLPAEVSTCLFRVVQEALGNVQKHAEAGHVTVTVNCQPDQAELIIEDDGRGFVPETVHSGQHLGLISMRERVEQLNGRIEIVSAAGAGTTISIQIPMIPLSYSTTEEFS